MDNYSTASGLSAVDPGRVSIAVSFFRGNAAYGGAHVERCHRTGIATTTNWAEFAIGLRRQFEPINAIRVARDKLARLRQDKSVQDYTARFRTIVLQVPDMSEAELMDRFIRGLKPAAQRELELHPPATFDDAVILAERVDAVEWRVRSASSSSRPAPSYGYASQAYHGTGATPMELGSMRHKPPPLTPGQRRRLRDNNGCFYCRELNANHVALNCPKKREANSGGKPPTNPHLSQNSRPR